ncbi:unnamed protein product [Sphagnum jensenii]|uniref:Cytochrome b5 heme-binding domain-containing protein n=1 Tax=Sphagnum jensenii TaxID=128206 RepID=A0ABP0V8W4_9BRYO
MAAVGLRSQIYSRSEILRHNNRDDCWIIVCNNVYDITAFIAAHPGGSDILLCRAGEDATSYFIAKHGNNKTVQAHLARLKIGELPDTEKIKTNDFDEPFLMELIDRCYQEKLYSVPTGLKSRFVWVRLLNIISFFALSYAVLYGGMPWYLRILGVLVQALIGTSLFGLVAHEATHRHFPESAFLRLSLSATWPVFWPFISQGPLRYEHNSHHIKIGDPEFDYEVAAFAPLMRYSGYVEYAPIHGLQHRTARFMYPFYANIITTIGGIRSGFWARHNRSVAVEHIISVLVTMLYYIVIPTLINGSLGWYVLLYMIYQCSLFYGIYVGAAINHFVPSASEPIPEEHHNKYGYYICHNTTNFCSSNPFWFWYTGGFNVQIEHHLIPFIPVENLRRMVPIVRELCAKYGYPYQDYRKFGQLWNDHYAYLESLASAGSRDRPNVEWINKTSYQGR